MTQSLAITSEAVATDRALSLPGLIDRAVTALVNARTAAEVLEARDLASVAYDIAKKAARLARAKQAHDELIATAYRTQANALEIEAEAKRRLADEYDAAQDRGEVQLAGGDRKSINVLDENNDRPALPDLGISRKDIHEARIIRDAEKAEPGIVSRTVNEAVAAGEEPSKAKVRRAVLQVVRPKPAAPVEPESELECSRDPREAARAYTKNVILEAERLAGLVPDLSSLKSYADLADSADRVVRAWSAIAAKLREHARP